jgi:hypothetical protein
VTIDDVSNKPWTRKHDLPGSPHVPAAPRILYPHTLEDLISICNGSIAEGSLRAAGSHWALSEAAVSDRVFVETHDPNNVFAAMGRTLFDVVPGCLDEQFISHLARMTPPPYDSHRSDENGGTYLVHVETGKRVYQLYSELDLGDDDNEHSLARLLSEQHGNSGYLGPWAFQTLGGAGGQTVFGALTTGTHGGDHGFPPIADSVEALHLVVDGGRHFWVEPGKSTNGIQLTNDQALRTLYGAARYGGPENFGIIRSDDVFNAVLICAARFGIVYSIVLRAVRQYSLHEERRLTTWEAVKSSIPDLTSELYSRRFLQVAVSVTPHSSFTQHLCGVTKRWNVPRTNASGTLRPAGRFERRGDPGPFDPQIGGPRFSAAGTSHIYSPDPANPGATLPPSFLERACSNARFMEGVVEQVYNEIADFVHSNGAVIGGTIAVVAAAGGAPLLTALLPFLLLLLLLLFAFLEALRNDPEPRLAQKLDDLRSHLLDTTDPEKRAAGIFIWQCIVFEMWKAQQGDHDYEAISYAVMDGHDYRDKSCNVNVDSLEVFFDATDPMLIAYVDALLAFEVRQENLGRAFVGYVSLRFTGPTRALLGMERFTKTCAVEVAGLKDVSGTVELIDFASSLARNPNFRGIFHWGQRNDCTMSEVQERFGDTLALPAGNLHTWRSVLGRLTENGRFDRFSTSFTRRLGLEVVSPLIQFLRSASPPPGVGAPVVIEWDCSNNPPNTEVVITAVHPSGLRAVHRPLLLTGSLQIAAAAEMGRYIVRITAIIRLNGEARQRNRVLGVTIV